VLCALVAFSRLTTRSLCARSLQNGHLGSIYAKPWETCMPAKRIICCGCQKQIVSEDDAKRISSGLIKSDKFKETEEWGVLHRSCFNRCIDSPAAALDEVMNYKAPIPPPKTPPSSKTPASLKTPPPPKRKSRS